MMVISKLQLEQGTKIPRGYGIAWHNMDTHSAVVLPLGINIIVAYLRKLYHRIILGLNDKYMAAYNSGITRGIEIGKQMVADAGLEKLNEFFKMELDRRLDVMRSEGEE